MSVEEHKKEAGKCKFAILTISTSRYEKYGSLKNPDLCEDLSGKIIKELLTAHGHEYIDYSLVPDDMERIRESILNLISSEANAIICTGGTGLAPRDVTIESIKPLLEKEIPGFGELFRFKSLNQIGSAAMLTRAIAGVLKNKVVFCLPGSPDAVSLAITELILPEIGHILKHLRD
ncbi:MAG: MogA/MoaB family molybdenum cofactor biosynthesis protein [Methanocellales archaeon]